MAESTTYIILCIVGLEPLFPDTYEISIFLAKLQQNRNIIISENIMNLSSKYLYLIPQELAW